MSYISLIRALDGLCKEAPREFKTYHPKKNDTEKINQARAKAFIHLFIKVRFGITTFNERHKLICDGTQDGGVDAYYIDTDTRTFYFIQSKFRTSESNFESKSIEVHELLRMEVGRISKGEETDSNGNQFSAKVKELQRAIRDMRDQALYKWKVVILANVKRVNDEQIRRLLDGLEYEVFDHLKAYNELVFPLTTGTYFKPSEITIKINLGKKSHPQLNQEVTTSIGNSNVRMLYVPVIEVARIMAKYKNSVLKYNPRNYLSLKNNDVNQSIKETILNTTENEFSMFNNGITILAKLSSVTDRTGTSGEGQLIIEDPQIINGGQTATTLAMLYEDKDVGKAVFNSKEVLLKIIEQPEGVSEDILFPFIEQISDATNKQSKIVEADRRSNDIKIVKLQTRFFEEYGLYFERKRGEFQYGLDEGIVKKT